MRLIDADALRKRILRARWGGWIRGDVLEQMLDSEPTIDPVVRCKDCIYGEDAKGVAEGVVECKRLKMVTKDDWYCAEGRRKDETALQD